MAALRLSGGDADSQLLVPASPTRSGHHAPADRSPPGRADPPPSDPPAPTKPQASPDKSSQGDWSLEELPGTQGSTSATPAKPQAPAAVEEPVSKKTTQGDWSIEEVPATKKDATPPAPAKKTTSGDWEIEEVTPQAADGTKPQAAIQNKPADTSPVKPFIPLFNGRDLTGWHEDVPAFDGISSPGLTSPFIVRDGLLVSLGEPRGHLITDTIFGNYRLEVQYRFPGEPGNCGVLVHASLPRALYSMFPQSIEVQLQSGEAGDFWCIQEDITVPDMVARRGPQDTWGVSDGKARRIKNLTDGSEKPLGEWNTLVIETLGNEIRVALNGELVNVGTNCTANKGQIALQSEGTEVEFRKIILTSIERFSEFR